MLITADAPNTADWMQGWGAVLSLPLAFFALVFTGLLLRHEMRARREERHDNEAAQARLVRLEGSGVHFGENSAAYEVSYFVKNFSDKPVFNVRVLLEQPDGLSYQRADDKIGPTLEGGGEATLVASRTREASEMGGYSYSAPPAILAFQDIEGRGWGRVHGVREPERLYYGMTRSHAPTLSSLIIKYLRIDDHARSLAKALRKPLKALKALLVRRIRLREHRIRQRELHDKTRMRRSRNSPDGGPTGPLA